MKKAQKKKEEWQQQGHGEYSEIPEEKEFFNVTKNSENVVCHFYREETFRQCCVFTKSCIFMILVFWPTCVYKSGLRFFVFRSYRYTVCGIVQYLFFAFFVGCISKRCSGSVTFWNGCGWGS
jgi:hypothetical protein